MTRREINYTLWMMYGVTLPHGTAISSGTGADGGQVLMFELKQLFQCLNAKLVALG